MTHKELVEAIKKRGIKSDTFNRGILTADRYVKTLQDCVGSDMCYKFASKGNISFEDILTKATDTLTYNNKEMVLQDTIDHTKALGLKDIHGNELQLPKNTLMVFRHVLTTPHKDRDGDILRTEGASVDPEMLLLWQHVHTLPIGKMLGTVEHSSKQLELISAIVDMNELSHDAAVMVDNKMGRFSHGFSALEFEEMKEGGFDITKYHIMEESLVSVPSNTDARTQEVMLSLVEGGKMKSPLMKAHGKAIREALPVQSKVTYKEKMGDYEKTIEVDCVGDFETIFNKTQKTKDEKEVPNENESRDRSNETEAKRGQDCSCPSKETNDNKTETKDPENKDLKIEEKSGRSLSKQNLATLEDILQDIGAISKEDGLSRGGSAICERCITTLTEIIKLASSSESDTESERKVEVDAKQAMALFIALSDTNEKQKMIDTLKAITDADERSKNTKEILSLVGM